MKLLLIAMAMLVSAQTFASDCELPNKHPALSAKKVTCDETTGQVRLDGVRVEKFGKKRNIVIPNYGHELFANRICMLFGLGTSESYEFQTFYSYFSTGIYLIPQENGKLALVEESQSEQFPVQSVVCNEKID